MDSQAAVWIAGDRLLRLAARARGWTDEGLAGAVTAPGAPRATKDGTLWDVHRGSEALVSCSAGGAWSVVPPEMGGFPAQDRRTSVPAAGLFVLAVGTAWAAAISTVRVVGGVSAVTPPRANVLWRANGSYAVIPLMTPSSPGRGEVVAPFALSSMANPAYPTTPAQLRFGSGMEPRPITPPTCAPISRQTSAGITIAFAPTGAADAAGPAPVHPVQPDVRRRLHRRASRHRSSDQQRGGPVGAGLFGHHDLADLVWEWCADVRADPDDPPDPEDGPERVVREGSGDEPLRTLQGTFRRGKEARSQGAGWGFGFGWGVDERRELGRVGGSDRHRGGA